MNILSIEAVCKSYGFKPLLEEVTFGIDAGEKVGLIGSNGSGKSTLIRILSGQEPPDAGRVAISRSCTLSTLQQNPVFDETGTVLDAVFPPESPTMRLLHDYQEACRRLESSGGADERWLERVATLTDRISRDGIWDLEANARIVLTQLGITDIHAEMGTLSGGLRKRVALARTLVSQSDLLVLDEPTNHLDAATIEWLEAHLRDHRGALLLVTHDRYFLDRVTDRILEVDRGRVRSFSGNYAYYLEKKADIEHHEDVAEQRRETILRRELAWLRRGARARATKEKAHIQRIDALLDASTVRDDRRVEISAATSRLGKKIVEIDHVRKSYDGRTIVADFSYTFKRGDRIGIIGPNGIGKSTLLDLIAGVLDPDAGSVAHGKTVVVGYYDQEPREVDASQRVIDHVQEVASHMTLADGETIPIGRMLERFLFPPDLQYGPIGKLSGGERRRLFLLRLLAAHPNVLLLDEPTNDLDIATLQRLEGYLDTYTGCLVVVSHDRYFLDRTVDHIFAFEGDGSIRGYPGNFSAYLEQREREEAERAVSEREKEPRARAVSPPENAPASPTKGLTYKEQRELEELEARIDASEGRRAEIEATIANAGGDYLALQALSDELETLNRSIEQDLARWAELAERV